jgi:hypothetical protein
MMQRALANEGERESAPSVGDMAKQIDALHAGELALLREVADCGVSFDDGRLAWVEVQIDRATWEAVKRYATPGGR